MVVLQQLERRLRQNLESWAGAEGMVKTSLLAGLQEKAAALSPEEIREKRAFAASVAGAGWREEKNRSAAGKQPERRKRPLQSLPAGLSALAALATIAMLVFFWPQAVKATTRLPLVGTWVQELVLRDAGLSWAYDNGFMENSQVSVSREGITLTVLGTVADPVQTTVIYLLDGWKPPGGELSGESRIYRTPWRLESRLRSRLTCSLLAISAGRSRGYFLAAAGRGNTPRFAGICSDQAAGSGRTCADP